MLEVYLTRNDTNNEYMNMNNVITGEIWHA